jgi:hypothetical protein
VEAGGSLVKVSTPPARLCLKKEKSLIINFFLSITFQLTSEEKLRLITA